MNLPRAIGEKYREPQSAFGYIRRQAWTNPADAVADLILNDAADNQTHTTFLAQPDFARTLQIVASGAATEVVTINGTNIRGEAISEALTLNGTTPVLSTKAFKTVTSVVFPDTAGGRTIDLGTSVKLGLDRCMAGNEVIMATAGGTKEGTLPTVTYHATDVSKNTVDFNTAYDGAADFVVVYVSTEKTNKTGSSA